jgi:hypothetical protein
MNKPEVQNEVFCQMIKQSTRHPYPNSPATAQCWQLLALCLPIFQPSEPFLTYLRFHLQAHASAETEVGRIVTYCQAMLKRVEEHGRRRLSASKVEVRQSPTTKPT